MKTTADFEQAELARQESLPRTRLRPPVEEWEREARCHGEWDLFHLKDSDQEKISLARKADINEAKQVCLVCPVLTECLVSALREDDRYGVRGATTPRERKAVKDLPLPEAVDTLLDVPTGSVLAHSRIRPRGKVWAELTEAQKELTRQRKRNYRARQREEKAS